VLIHFRTLIYFMIVTIMLAGCSTKAVVDNMNGRTGTVEKSNGIFSTEPSDRELFEDALSYLSNNNNEPNYNEAKARLENLVAQFPKSKWFAGARALISSLDRISALQGQLRQENQKAQGENVKLTKEIEGLRDSTRQIEEKYAAEIIRLRQENEQLKNDIQQLKNLELQLEKREKMLR
jgi:DNA repair ATPase RecN